MTTPAIEVHDVLFSYERTFTLSVPQLTIHKGECVCVLGLNGSGKTTLLHVLAQVLPLRKGNSIINGVESSLLSRMEIARRVALVEQETRYIFPYTVLETVLMGRFAHCSGRFFESPHDMERAAWAMETTNVVSLSDRIIFHLSGGERRRVEIARALCQETDIVLFDEPTAFLDIRQQQVFRTLLQRLKDEGKTLVIVTHDTGLVQSLAARCLLMKEGTIVADLAAGSEVSEAQVLEIIG